MIHSVLITGINGFIGKHTAKEFLRAGFKVCGADLQPNCAVCGVEYRSCDLTDEQELRDSLQDLSFDTVVHLAAVLAMDSPNTLRINTLAAYHMLRLAREKQCGRFLHLSSIPIIGVPPLSGEISEETPSAPRTAYHVSKLAVEQLVMLPEFSGMQRYNLRIPSPIGPGMPRSFLRIMLEKALEGENLTVYGSGNRVQNYLDARDIAVGLVSVAQTEPAEGLYLLGGTPVSNLAAAELCRQTSGGSGKLVMTGLPDTAENEHWLVNCDKARKNFGFAPRYGLEESLRDLAEEIRCAS